MASYTTERTSKLTSKRVRKMSKRKKTDIKNFPAVIYRTSLNKKQRQRPASETNLPTATCRMSSPNWFSSGERRRSWISNNLIRFFPLISLLKRRICIFFTTNCLFKSTSRRKLMKKIRDFVWWEQINPVSLQPLPSEEASIIYMVAVVQLVRASDCGSECRGFESHLPPIP